MPSVFCVYVYCSPFVLEVFWVCVVYTACPVVAVFPFYPWVLFPCSSLFAFLGWEGGGSAFGAAVFALNGVSAVSVMRLVSSSSARFRGLCRSARLLGYLRLGFLCGWRFWGLLFGGGLGVQSAPSVCFGLAIGCCSVSLLRWFKGGEVFW